MKTDADHMQPHTIVFDLGNVLIGWEPRALYGKLFSDAEVMERFLRDVCNSAWNLEQDRGRRFASAVVELCARQPTHLHAAIQAYNTSWHEMLTGEISGSVELLHELSERGTALYALTNWNQEKFVHARERYAWLERFRGIVVSGEEGCVKPEPEIYRILLQRYALEPAGCVFIDDNLANVAGAQASGMQAVHFRDPLQLRAELRALGFAV